MGEELKFEHEKSNQVDGAIKAGAKFQEDAPLPLLMWFPVVVLGLTAIDYFMLFFNENFANFFNGDTTWPLLGGVFFGLMYLLVTLGLFWRRRWAVWTTVALLIVEGLFAYYIVAGGSADVFVNMRVPLMEAGSDGLVHPVPGTDIGFKGGEFYLIRDGFILLITLACVPWTE